MTLIIGALILGFLSARLKLLPKVLDKNMHKLGSLALLLLLFSMGISLGINQEIIKALPILGLKAVVISVGTILGSVTMVWFITKIRRPN